jgi:protein TonB
VEPDQPRPSTAEVVLKCDIDRNGRASGCEVVSETPAGQGFGQAALRIVRRHRYPGPREDATLRIPFSLYTQSSPGRR